MKNNQELLWAFRSVHHTFHKMWGQAKDREYSKRDWINFDNELTGLIRSMFDQLGYSGPLLN